MRLTFLVLYAVGVGYFFGIFREEDRWLRRHCHRFSWTRTAAEAFTAVIWPALWIYQVVRNLILPGLPRL